MSDTRVGGRLAEGVRLAAVVECIGMENGLGDVFVPGPLGDDTICSISDTTGMYPTSPETTDPTWSRKGSLRIRVQSFLHHLFGDFGCPAHYAIRFSLLILSELDIREAIVKNG